MKRSRKHRDYKEAVKGIRNVRNEMNVPPSRKSKVIVVSSNEEIRNIFTDSQLFLQA